MSLVFNNYLDMEYKDGSDDSLRRLTDEFGRHKLTDVQEENEEDTAANSTLTTSRRNRYSSIGSTASSMDYLWDLHPRRLSEAGLSRHSDNSTILTEDTDSFIIGQRVWVGGSKPGSIAYIGETLFAPGDWAGIVLDQPIGKNDGSVGGTRYFQCEPKKGVFSRLTRLTRYPLNDTDVVDAVTSTPVNGSRRSPISPTGSASPIKSPLSFSMSNTSLTSAHVDFKLGDRVIIKSSQGSKIGALRFMGSTDFADGEWCGVELDEPRGKNDGSVAGKRYFDCRPNFGLFAPITKVSKSPSNRKPVACVVHSGPGIPPSGFRRANSKESLASNTSITSAASGVRRVRLGVTSLTTPQRASPKAPSAPLPTRTALQEVLKEKQQHIEQLLKERDLERAEIAKAASQADEAEQKFATLKQDSEFYRSDTEKKLQEHLNLLTQLTNHRSELLTNLEDEKRKNEDLQFRFEEAAITKADLEVTIEDNTNRIAELENQLTSERQRIEVLEGDSNKLFEAEEHLVRIKEENEALRYEIEVAAQKIQSLETEGVSTKDLATSHQKELEELNLVIKQKDNTIEKIKTDIQSISDQYEQSRINFTREIDEQKAKYNTANTEFAGLKSKFETILTELNQKKIQLDEQAITLERTIASAKESEVKLNKEIDKLKMNLSAKVLDIETNNDLINKKTGEIEQLKLDLDSLESQNSDLNKFRENVKEIEDNLRKELEESKSTVKLKVDEIEQVKTSLTKIIAERDDELTKANEMIKNHTENIDQLNASIIHLKEDNIRINEEVQSNFSQKLKKVELKQTDSTKIIEEKEEALKKSASEISKLEDLLKKKNEESNEMFNKNNEETTLLRLNIGDLERKVKSFDEKAIELIDQKVKLENEVRTLIGSSGDFSNKLNDMSKELQEKDKNIENIKDDFQNKLQDLERSKDEIQLRFNQYIQKSEKDLMDRDQIINNLTVDKDGIKAELDRNSTENKSSIGDLSNRINELQVSLENKENLLKKTEHDIKEIQENSKVTIEKIQGDYNTRNEDLQKKLGNALKESEEVNEVLSKKSSEILELQTKYNEQVELSNKSGNELKISFEAKVQNLEKQLAEKEQEKLNQIEIGKNQLDEKIKEIENQKDELRKELEVKLAAAEKSTNEQLEENKVLLLELEKLNQNSEKTLAESTKTIDEFKREIKNLQNASAEKDLSMQRIQEEYKLKEIQLNDQLSKYSGDIQSNLKEFQTQIDNLNKEKSELTDNVTEKSQEITSLEKKYNELVEKSKEDESVLKNGFEEEKKKMVEQLNTLSQEINDNSIEREKLKEIRTNQELSSSEKDNEISQLKSELQINHQFVNKIQLEKKELLQQKENLQQSDQEKGKLCTELNNTVSQLSKEMQNVNETSYNLQTANNLYVTILQLLQLSEVEKIDLVDRMEAAKKNEIDMENYAKLCKLVDGIKVHDDNSREVKINELEKEIETHKEKRQELENKLKRQETQIPRYKNEPKPQDVHKVVNDEKKLDNSNESSLINNNPITNEQLMEEKLLAESQVTFLNSIIVDMQKKNEDQKARIEILESGYSPADADEFRLLRLTDRQLPPRMYCDICEEFDLHETEDCPQQANEDLPARERSPREKPAERPYCEICEVFGHATEDCQEDQTF